MDQEFMVKGNLMDQFQATLDQFGPGGSLRDKWGRHALPEVKTHGNPADRVVSRATRWLRYAAIILPYSPNVLEEDAFWEVHIQYPALSCPGEQLGQVSQSPNLSLSQDEPFANGRWWGWTAKSSYSCILPCSAFMGYTLSPVRP